ncbi:palmitoyltransferase ZDHHC6 [Strongylocentrotus purpuratus]|uniref:Palmitoyltransferase n=1 Tax=Strongylocentrotus purpuratus TaxID=7668 RepID=A0A7M7NGT5_STRPU|nr:palmitoyltransferase ZDHHC6 [Strongylocentrotus purpuratus]
MCFGPLRPLRQLCHWGPFIAIFLMLYITTNAVICALVVWPPLKEDPLSVAHCALLVIWCFIIFYHYFYAMFLGPGFVPKGWKPEKQENEKYLQYCQFCEGYKAPRAHHCRYCKRCVMKMDHHCPWINTCCGHFNHAHFTSFLIFAVLGCGHGAIVCMYTLYIQVFQIVLYPRRRYMMESLQNSPYLTFGFGHLICAILAVGFALGVCVAVGVLFVIQMRSILKNETGIESWIKTKANARHKRSGGTFRYPYLLGWKKNLREVFTMSGIPKGDGITWSIIDGCDQYTLTKEQLAQKAEKKHRLVEYEITDDYSGYICTFSHGLCTLIRVPLSDEPRIPVEYGDIVMVSRWKKYWLYGDVVLDSDDEADEDTKKSKKRVRGWFPANCAKELKFEEEEEEDGRSNSHANNKVKSKDD